MVAALAIVAPVENLAVPADLIESARTYARASKADATKQAYARDWAAFAEWCASKGLSSLPAAPATVALYLTDRANKGAKVASLTRYLASISQAHKAGGFQSPRGAAEVQETLKGIRRTLGTAQKQVAPLLPADLRSIMASLPDSLHGLRDRALLLVGFAGAFRRSELVALDVADFAFTADGLEILLRRSKTDQEAKGTKKGLPYGSDAATCPVRAVKAWLDASGIKEGPVFREVNRHGQVSETRLAPASVAYALKRACEAAGINPERFSGHSLRAGLATAAALAGKSRHAIRKQTGHRSDAMLDRYIRDAELWKDNAASGIGL